MTRLKRTHATLNSESSVVPDDLVSECVEHPVGDWPEHATIKEECLEYPQETSNWSEEIITKPELIIPEDDQESVKTCRVCGRPVTAWIPCYNANGDLVLEPGHFDAIHTLTGCQVTSESDYSSVVCFSCLMHLDVVKHTFDSSGILTSEGSSHNEANTAVSSAVETTEQHVASTNNTLGLNCLPSSQHVLGNHTNSILNGEENILLSTAATITNNITTENTMGTTVVKIESEDDIIALSDSDTSVELIYDISIKRKITKTKEQLIEEAMRLVKKQYKRKKTRVSTKKKPL